MGRHAKSRSLRWLHAQRCEFSIEPALSLPLPCYSSYCELSLTLLGSVYKAITNYGFLTDKDERSGDTIAVHVLSDSSDKKKPNDLVRIYTRLASCTVSQTVRNACPRPCHFDKSTREYQRVAAQSDVQPPKRLAVRLEAILAAGLTKFKTQAKKLLKQLGAQGLH